MKRVELWLKETSQAISHDFINTYTKDGLYCIYTEELNQHKVVYKYPLINIWRIKEDY